MPHLLMSGFARKEAFGACFSVSEPENRAAGPSKSSCLVNESSPLSAKTVAAF
jgi:hypothetical protein